MKAVIYHADAKPLWDAPAGMYEKLFNGFKKAAHKFKIDPANIVYNREICFTQFLKDAPDDTYWFTEPDARIVKMFKPLNGDACFLYREDEVAMTPSFRLARKSALPIFERIVECFDGRKDWHGDSAAFTKVYREMGRPKLGRVQYLGLEVEMRDYFKFTRKDSEFVTHHKFDSKTQLLL